MIDAALTGAGWIDLVTSTILVGGILYAALVGPPSERGDRALRVAAAVLAIALVAEFAVTALRMREVSDVRGFRLVVDLAATRWGTLWILRGVGLPLLVGRTRAAVAVAAPWLFLRSLAGHAGAHGTVPALVDGLHLGAAAVWLGGLVQLALLPGRVPAAVARRMRALATTALALLVPAGVYGAVLHVQHWHMLLTSPYGRVLTAKLVLAAVLVSLGAVNHYRHVPAIVGGDAAAAESLSRTVVLEVVVGAAVLLCSALLGVLPMPHMHPG